MTFLRLGRGFSLWGKLGRADTEGTLATAAAASRIGQGAGADQGRVIQRRHGLRGVHMAVRTWMSAAFISSAFRAVAATLKKPPGK